MPVQIRSIDDYVVCRALGLSHALGHKLGAKYGIPHGITSVSIDGAALLDCNTDFDMGLLSQQCLTLAPVVGLKAETASQEDKEALAAALFYLRQESTGSVDGDVRKLSSLIQQCVCLVKRCLPCF